MRKIRRKTLLLLFSVFSSLLFSSGCGDEFGILLNDAESSPGLHRGIYWTEYNKTINRANKDGSARQTLLTCSGTPLDIDIYPSEKKIYWTEYTGTAFQIRRAGIDGTNNELIYQPTNSDFGPAALAIDRQTGTLYWNEYASLPGHNDVWHSPVHAPVKWVKTINPFYTFTICLDTVNRKIYVSANAFWDVYSGSAESFGSGKTGIICDGNLNDGSYSSPVNMTGPSDNSIPLRGIAIDGALGYVYYVNNDVSGNQTIRRALSSNITTSEEWISPGTYSIRKITLDLKMRKIYWISAIDSSIWRADLDTGLNIEQILVLDSIPTGIAIVP